jgi:hypothetical protein
VLSQNCGVIIYYTDNSKDELSSFDRFEFHNAGSSVQVESVFIKYDFLIVPSKSKKPQSYSAEIRIVSSVALQKRLDFDHIFGLPRSIMRLMGNRTAYSKIEYIDYTVARSIQNVINDWFSVLPSERKNNFLTYMRKRSHFIPRIIRVFTVIASSVICAGEGAQYIISHPLNQAVLFQIIMQSFILIYGAYVLSSWIGEYSEHKIDNWYPLSYLKFNKADEIEIEKYTNKNRKSIVHSGFSIIAGLCTSVIVKLIAAVLYSFLEKPH